ncbi:MAG: nucleotidyltransferase [Flavobacteriales bacterium]|nr:nucleotidyltransferase [Flavobacteriales bacterium]
MPLASAPILVIMAAGMGSRYGGNKQIDSFGPNGETLMDYSIYDALQAGFKEIIFIIRPDFEEDFRQAVLRKLEGHVPYKVGFQEVAPDIPGVGRIPRSKPWGTCHAILSVAHLIEGPFVVINADDFYGRQAYQLLANFFRDNHAPLEHALAGFRLGDTLSPHGTVSRGVCQADGQLRLVGIKEHTQVKLMDGEALSETADGPVSLPLDSLVSMNFWGFKPSILPLMERLFLEFVAQHKEDPKAEFYIPLAVDHAIRHEGHTVSILPCEGPWFGVTYREDRPHVANSIRELVDQGVYPSNLFE